MWCGHGGGGQDVSQEDVLVPGIEVSHDMAHDTLLMWWHCHWSSFSNWFNCIRGSWNCHWTWSGFVGYTPSQSTGMKGKLLQIIDRVKQKSWNMAKHRSKLHTLHTEQQHNHKHTSTWWIGQGYNERRCTKICKYWGGRTLQLLPLSISPCPIFMCAGHFAIMLSC